MTSIFPVQWMDNAVVLSEQMITNVFASLIFLETAVNVSNQVIID